MTLLSSRKSADQIIACYYRRVNSLLTWCENHGLIRNLSKSQQVRFSLKRSNKVPIPDNCYSYDRKSIVISEAAKCLGEAHSREDVVGSSCARKPGNSFLLKLVRSDICFTVALFYRSWNTVVTVVKYGMS